MKLRIDVEVKSTEISEKSGTGRNGKPYSIREQVAWADTGKAFPEEIRVNLGDRQPYEPGKYVIDESAVYVGRFGALQFGRFELKPVAAAAGQGSAGKAAAG